MSRALTSSVPAPALIREQADMRAAIMAGSTFSSMEGTSSSASLFPTSGSPPLQVAAEKSVLNIRNYAKKAFFALHLENDHILVTIEATFPSLFEVLT